MIRRTAEGQFVGWIPSLPGVTACGDNEDEIIHRLSREARALLDRIVARGLRLPTPAAPDTLPLGDRHGLYRRVLLVLG
ncbi:type II toxin-antitoxin system HicB family antitoxin [Reyranella sp.]|uniref:type II toxin-antitoxin system HicB family antitoxin n=1 Tax=Reyranella sp. TaxID=1929291 RepID=UPI003BAB28A6